MVDELKDEELEELEETTESTTDSLEEADEDDEDAGQFDEDAEADDDTFIDEDE